MRILMTTGIFEPESGGPATLTPKIATRLVADGHRVTVITYSDLPSYDFDAQYNFELIRVVRQGNRLTNYTLFLFAVLRHIIGKDLVYSLDWLAAGLPVTVAAAVFRTPVVIRVGGDYMWERYLETDAEPIPLTDFYARRLHERFTLLFRLIRFVLQRADVVVFNTDIQREMYHREYGLLEHRTRVIYNPVPTKGWLEIERTKVEPEIVFASRFVAMKNAEVVIRAFAKAALPDEYRLILIGDGPERETIEKLVRSEKIQNRTDVLPGMRQKDLYERIRNCRVLVQSSWTDISPNQVYEAMLLKIPMIVTEENYLSIRDRLPLTINPRSVDDVASKLELITDDAKYADFTRRWNALSFEYDWDREMKEHYAVFDSALGK